MVGKKSLLIVATACISFLLEILANVAVSKWVMSNDSYRGINKPNYDSGWTQLAWGQSSVTLTHNLGTTEVLCSQCL